MGIQRQCVVIFLAINILPSHTSTYPVVLNITTQFGSGTIGLGVSSDSLSERQFLGCVCRKRSTCDMPFEVYETYPERPSQVLTAEYATSYSQATSYRCEYKQKLRRQIYEVSCLQESESTCTTTPCTINIIHVCQNGGNIVLSWERSQEPSVVSVSDVTVIDCCQTSPTTTEATRINTTPPSTSFASTQPTTDLTTATFVRDSTITSVAIVQSTSPMSDTSTTSSTPSDTALQRQEAADASSLTSGQLTGIIVGTAVAALLITLLIIYILWKSKTRREKNRRREQTETRMQVSGNLRDTQVSNLRYGHQGTKKTSKAIAHVSPLVQSHESESHLPQTRGDYTYIDIKSAASSKSSPSPVVKENHQISTTADVVPDTPDSEYSHLGASKVKLENPYDWLDHQSSSTTIEPIIIPESCYGDTSYVHIRPANHRISQDTEQGFEANENNGLYSHLGESKAARENTYDSLNRINDQPITETRFTQKNHTTNHNSEIRDEPTLSHDHKRDIFTHSSKRKSMEIVDVAPSTYTTIIPKTKREIPNDSSHLTDTLNQANLTPSSTGQLIPREATSLKSSAEINMTPGTVHSDKGNTEREDKSGQTYDNSVYSMNVSPTEDNTTFSLEECEYANVT